MKVKIRSFSAPSMLIVFSSVFLTLLMPSLLAADSFYGGVGLDFMEWSEEGTLDDATHGTLDAAPGAALLVGYRLSGFLSMEIFAYSSSYVYLKDSDTDYLDHFMIGVGPRVNILDARRFGWTPWFSWYATYHSIDRNRPAACCDENPEHIRTVMKGTGKTSAMGLDINVAPNFVLQLAVRESSVRANWDDPGFADTDSSATEYLIALSFNLGANGEPDFQEGGSR